MRVLGIPIESPQTVANRIASDIGSIARLARSAPAQLDRMLELGEEIADIGRGLLEIAERLDRRAEAVMALGERLDRRAGELLDMVATCRRSVSAWTRAARRSSTAREASWRPAAS